MVEYLIKLINTNRPWRYGPRYDIVCFLLILNGFILSPLLHYTFYTLMHMLNYLNSLSIIFFAFPAITFIFYIVFIIFICKQKYETSRLIAIIESIFAPITIITFFMNNYILDINYWSSLYVMTLNIFIGLILMFFVGKNLTVFWTYLIIKKLIDKKDSDEKTFEALKYLKALRYHKKITFNKNKYGNIKNKHNKKQFSFLFDKELVYGFLRKNKNKKEEDVNCLNKETLIALEYNNDELYNALPDITKIFNPLTKHKKF